MFRVLIAGATAALMPIATAQASAEAPSLCFSEAAELGVGEALSEWSQNFPFAKVIIGADGKYGDVIAPEVVIETPNFLVCRGTYQLVKVAPDGHGYTVRIPALFYRVTKYPGGFKVALEDMPTSLDDSSTSSRELLSRFTIDGRPYLDVLEENRRRLQQRGRGNGR